MTAEHQWTRPKGWWWVVGMTAVDRVTGVRGVVTWVGANTLDIVPTGSRRAQPHDLADVFPDFNDATLGCLLALVRAVWGDPTMSASRCMGGWDVERWDYDSGRAKWLQVLRGTEHDALLAALESAP